MHRNKPSLLTDTLSTCWTHFAAIAGFSLALNLLYLAVPLYSMQLYDRVLLSGSGATLFLVTIAALISMVAFSALDSIRTRLLISMGLRIDAGLSVSLFEHLVETGARSRGSQRSQTLADLDSLRQFITGSGTLALMDLPWAPVYLMMCFIVHPWLGIVSSLGAAALLALAMLNQAMISAPFRASNEKAMVSYALTETALRNAEVVQAMGMLPALIVRWKQVRAGLMFGQAAASIRNSDISAAIKFFRNFLQIAMMGTGAWLAIDHSITAGGLFAASMISARALVPIDQVVGVWRQLVTARGSLRRVQEALAAPGRPVGMGRPSPAGRLTVEDVTHFATGTDRPILKDVSFEVEPGEAIGIVGPSAAGKSSLARLLVGVIQPTKGTVRLDGGDVFSWERGDFGRHVGYLPQDIELFRGTIRENISRFGEGDPALIVEAARRAGVDDMILHLPKGYDTQVGEDGMALSGGQRQRIALARAIYGTPKLLVLDEPNSNLDSEGEDALKRLFLTLKQEKVTVVVIAHRPSILSTVDKLLVLSNGSVAQFGATSQIMGRITPAQVITAIRRESGT